MSEQRQTQLGRPAPAAIIAVDRASGDLRRGGMVLVRDEEGGASLVLSPEYVNTASLDRLRAETGCPPKLVLSRHRAAALELKPGEGPVIALSIREGADPALLRDLADPSAQAIGRAVSTEALEPAMAHRRDAAAVTLAKIANLLPAAITSPLTIPDADIAAWAVAQNLLVVSVADVDAHLHAAAASLQQVSSAQVPLDHAENARIVAFRPADGGVEHIAVIVGEPPVDQPVLTRIHSQCFTGDLLGSLRCDCGDQLRGAVRMLGETGGGILLYLAQEGRGIGLVNKLRAYELQDQGYDTIDANRQLGFDADERHYRVAAEMLRSLGFESVRLLTNNPEKIAALARFGIAVVERVAHAFPANGHNQAYLATKARRAGHLL